MPDQNIISNIYINKVLELYHQYYPVNKNYPYQIHTITQALQLDHSSLVAIILYTNRQHDFNLEEHKHHFNDDIMYLVDNINKLTTIHDKPYAEQYIHFNKLLVTINSKLQEKVVLTTLVPLLYKVSIFNLEYNNKDAQHISEIMTNCYIPYFLSYTIHNDLAYLLQDLCFKIQDLEARNRILCYMHSLYPDIDNIIHNIEQQLRNIFSKLNIEASLSYRIKSPYSIWVKTLVKDIDITALNDILAFRAIVPNKKACYDVSKLIHLQYNTVKSCFVDYIKYPKNNGYQSIHLVISGSNKGNIELQIRSTTMHSQTQYGSAHNTYKANKYYVSRTKNNVNIIICNITLSYSNGIPSICISIFTITGTINNNLYSYNTIPSFIQTQHSTNFVVNNTTTCTLSRTTTPEYINYYTNNLSLFIKDISSDTIHQHCSRDINLNVSNMFEYKSISLLLLSNIISIIAKSLQGIFLQAITYKTIHDDSNIHLTSNKAFLHITNIVKPSHNNKLLHTINNQNFLKQFSIKKDLLNTSNTYKVPIWKLLSRPEARAIVSAISDQHSKDKILSSACILQRSELIPVLIKNGANVNAKTDSGATPLHRAAESGDLDLVYWLIYSGADVNAKTDSGETVLYYAVADDNLKLVQLLITHGADVNAKTDDGETPLHRAVYNENIKVISALMERGADVNAKTNHGETVLYYAVVDENLKLVQLLITHGADVNAKTDSGATPLHRAAKSGNLDLVYWLIYSGADVNAKTDDDQNINVVRELIEHGAADVNAKTDSGETPLHRAAAYGDLDLVYWLIYSGADVNAKTDDGETPLHRAVYNENIKVISALMERGADVNAKTNHGETVLYYAVVDDNLKLVQLLITHGANVNAKTDSGETPLHRAAKSGNLDLVYWLIYSGADVNAKTDDDQNINVVRELIEHGAADVNAKTDSGETPLHRAAESGDLDLVYWLIHSGADVNAKTDDGETVLHYAVADDNLKLVQLLITHGADVNVKTNHGATPLHRAVYDENIKVISALMERGADVNAKTDSGETILHYAIWSNNLELVDWLICSGANVNTKTDDGETPLYRALKYDNHKIILLLISHTKDLDTYDHSIFSYVECTLHESNLLGEHLKLGEESV